MILIKKDEKYKKYKKGDVDCVYRVTFGDLIKEVIRIGYSTTFTKDTGSILEEDIDKDEFHIYTCLNEDSTETYVYISIREYWNLIYVGRITGDYVGDTSIISTMVNNWVENN